jgi:hypothetical protein
MRHRMKLSACVALLAMWGCGDGAVAPRGGGADEMANRFDQLADSVEGEDWSPTAEALRHAARVVRLAGGATAVTLTVDGAERSFLAVAEQLDIPNLECTWPIGAGGGEPGDSAIVGPPPAPAPPDGGGVECEEVGTYSMRTLIAWEPDNLAEVVRIVADPGSYHVEQGVPDVMTGLPTHEADGTGGATPPEPGDSADGGGDTGRGGYPGFIGEYLVRDVGSFWSVEGTQTNELQGVAGPCTEDRATFDWAEFSCEAARFRFEFRMRVEAARYDPATGWDPGTDGGAEGSHELALGSSEVTGVRLRVIAWVPPPLPPPLRQ